MNTFEANEITENIIKEIKSCSKSTKEPNENFRTEEDND